VSALVGVGQRLSFRHIAQRLDADLDRYPPADPGAVRDLQHGHRRVDEQRPSPVKCYLTFRSADATEPFGEPRDPASRMCGQCR
jgi:hypothetical protein